MKNKMNEVYQDLEDRRLWTDQELVDLIIFLAHEHGNDMEFGKLVRSELLKFDSRRHKY
jgi:purine-nucleoside phosphorylase